MNDPYDVLGVARNAGEAAIRQRYLELVRLHSPERDPERFAEIREAYDCLRDPINSLKRRLFSCEGSPSFEVLVAEARPDIRDHRLPTKFLLALAVS